MPLGTELRERLIAALTEGLRAQTDFNVNTRGISPYPAYDDAVWRVGVMVEGCLDAAREAVSADLYSAYGVIAK